MPDPMTTPLDDRAFVAWYDKADVSEVTHVDITRIRVLAGDDGRLVTQATLRLDLAESNAKVATLEHELQMSDQVIVDERALAASWERTASGLGAERDALAQQVAELKSDQEFLTTPERLEVILNAKNAALAERDATILRLQTNAGEASGSLQGALDSATPQAISE